MSQRTPNLTAEPDTDLEAPLRSLRAFLDRYPTRKESASGARTAPAATEQLGSAPTSTAPVTIGSTGPMLPVAMEESAADAPAQANQVPEPGAPVASNPTPDSLFLEQGRVVPDAALWRHRWWLVAAIAVVVAGARLVFAVGGAAATGTLVVETNPAGVPVQIDGEPRGLTPLTVTLPPGPHAIDLAYGGDHRAVPVTITAGSLMSQYIELPRAIPALGELQIRTDPSGASVSVDGRSVGQAPVTVPNLAPGRHTVALRHERGSRTEQVLIESGRTTALVVPMASASNGKGAADAAAGWISVNAPAEVQIYENQRLLGTSAVDRIMVPAGRHELEIANDALGYRERVTVQVDAGEVTVPTLAWPKGTLAINAAPWAHVFVDEEGVGETPIGGLSLPIGTHDVVVRHPQLGERRSSVTVKVGQPARVGIDLRAQ